MGLFQRPPMTQWDLRFRFLGFNVQVHPLFWLMALLFGFSLREPLLILLWVVVVFVSILIHELGHALMMRTFGQDAAIALYLGGGLAMPVGGKHYNRWDGRIPDWLQWVLVSLAGPFAGFFLAGLIVLLGKLLGGFVAIRWTLWIIPNPMVFMPYGDVVNSVIQMLLWVNIFWGFINLLPVFPLDGGQVARQLFVRFDPWKGPTNSLWLSVVTGASVAVMAAIFLRSMYMALLFGMLALQSYQALQGSGRYY